MNDILKTIVSAIITHIVPHTLDGIGKTFTPAGLKTRTLPWEQWSDHKL